MLLKWQACVFFFFVFFSSLLIHWCYGGQGDTGMGRGATLCSCLLCCWNSALSANPFNSRPAVFVWVDEPYPDKWLDCVCV